MNAFKQLGIIERQRWSIEADPLPISDFFRQRLERLQRFDLESLEVSKTLLIDAICEEGLEGFDRLKVWKGAYLEGDRTCGNADYLCRAAGLFGGTIRVCQDLPPRIVFLNY